MFMLTHHRRPVLLSWTSTNLPLGTTIETAATLYQKDDCRFHLLLKDTPLPTSASDVAPPADLMLPVSRLLWLELSPYRVIVTMQGSEQSGYRHFFERGVYGVTRYWLHDPISQERGSMRLRNYTLNLELRGSPVPESLRLEYELWSGKLSLGHYTLSLEIH
jgi:hypothetical protein